MTARGFFHRLILQFGDLPVEDDVLRWAAGRCNNTLKKLDELGYAPKGVFDPERAEGRARGFAMLDEFAERIGDGVQLAAAILARRLRADLRQVRDTIFDAIDCRRMPQRRDQQRERQRKAWAARAARGKRRAA